MADEINGIKGFRQDKEPQNQLFDYVSQNETPDSNDSNDLIFYFPKYGVEEYINDRTIWQKQLYTIGGEQGWFYFKVFFNLFIYNFFCLLWCIYIPKLIKCIHIKR